MVAATVKRKRGRPRKTPFPPPQSAHGASPAELDTMIEDLAGNGRDEPPPPTWPEEPALAKSLEELERLEVVTVAKPAARPALPDLFIHRVENGYIVRPAFAQGDRRTSTDARTWVVADKQALATLVLELIAEPLVHPRPIPQPEAFYSPPLIVEAGVGP